MKNMDLKFQTLLIQILTLFFISLFNTPSTAQGKRSMSNEKNTPQTSKPECFDQIEDPDLKRTTLLLTEQVMNASTYPSDIQRTYQSTLEAYQKNLRISKSNRSRRCTLAFLVSMAKLNNDLSLREMMADWFNNGGNLSSQDIDTFTKDLEKIVDSSISKSFSKKWLDTLKRYKERSPD